MNSLRNFTNNFSDTVLQQVKVYMTENIAVFRPSVYVANQRITDENYHVVLPTSTPPPSYFGSREYTIQANRMLVVNPQTEFFCKKAVQTNEYTSVAINKAYLMTVAGSMGFDRDVVFSHIDNPACVPVNEILQQLQWELDTYGVSSPMVIDSIAVQLVAALLRNTDSNLRNAGIMGNELAKGHYIEIAKEYIGEHYSSNITIDDICKEIYMTPYHFIRAFNRATGKTPHEFLLDVRLEKAKELLSDDSLSVTKIGQLCGFVNSAHFSAAFKKKFGLSPLQCRKGIHIA